MTQPVSTTPIALEVRRKTRFDFSDVPAVHTRGNLYVSHFLTAISLATPVTEGILMRTARRITGEIDHPRLREELDAFIGQEATHTREHQRFNKHMASLGVAADDAVAKLEAAIRDAEDRMTLKEQMAAIVVGEHFVYCLARAGLARDATLAEMHPEARRLFVWHCLEEMEHQSVCHDLYTHLYGGGVDRYLTYMRVATLATTMLTRVYGAIFTALVDASPRPGTRDELRAFLRWGFARGGVVPLVARELGAFFSPRYRHWRRAEEDLGLIARAHTEVYGAS